MTEQIKPSLDDPLLSVKSVAKIFGVGTVQVRVWLKEGKIKGTKIMGNWRILQSEVTRVANEEYGNE